MQSPQAIHDFIANRIGYIYENPFGFAETAEELDSLLYYYHEILAFVLDAESQARAAYERVLEENDCGSKMFVGRYFEGSPDASREDAAKHAIEQWKRVDDILNVL